VHWFKNESVFAVSKLPKQSRENKWISSKYCAKTIAEVMDKTWQKSIKQISNIQWGHSAAL